MRRWQKMLLTAFALLLLLTAAAYWYLQKTLAALPLQNLQYQISSFSLRQLQLSSVSFSLDKPQLQVQLTDIKINWQLLNSKITRLQLGSADIRLLQWPQTTDKNAAPASAQPFPADWQVPRHSRPAGSERSRRRGRHRCQPRQMSRSSRTAAAPRNSAACLP